MKAKSKKLTIVPFNGETLAAMKERFTAIRNEQPLPGFLFALMCLGDPAIVARHTFKFANGMAMSAVAICDVEGAESVLDVRYFVHDDDLAYEYFNDTPDGEIKRFFALARKEFLGGDKAFRSRNATMPNGAPMLVTQHIITPEQPTLAARN